MLRNPFTLDPEKTVEVILYLAEKAGQDMYGILKMMYIADKKHLDKYGRFIFGDGYYALPHGPVPTDAYDMIKSVRGDGSSVFSPFACDAFRVEGKSSIIPLRSPDLNCLSKSDMNCLNQAIDELQHLSFSRQKNITHDAAYNATAKNAPISVEAIASTFADGGQLIDYLKHSE